MFLKFHKGKSQPKPQQEK